MQRYLAAVFALTLMLLVGSSEAPAAQLQLTSNANNALVFDDTADVAVAAEGLTAATEVRIKVTGWRGEALADMTVTLSPDQPQQTVTIDTPRYGPYDLHATIDSDDDASTTLKLVKVVKNPRLDQAGRSPSWIGVNIHHEPPWQALGDLGIHWVRGYTWGRIHAVDYPYPYDEPPSHEMYRKLWDDADAAGVTIMPCMQLALYNEDKTAWSNDPAVVTAAYRDMAEHYPEVEIWELDNEPDLRFLPKGVQMDNYRRYIELAHEGLLQGDPDTLLCLYGMAGIKVGEVEELLRTSEVEPVVADLFDAVSYHYYTGNQAPEGAAANTNYVVMNLDNDTGTLLDHQREMNRVAHEHGKLSLLTEIGWDVYYGHGAVGAVRQAVYLPRVFLLSRIVDTDKVFWYFDRDVQNMASKYGSCGLFDADYNARESAAAIAALSYHTALTAPGGDVDLGPTAWAAVLAKPDGGFVVGAWTFDSDEPLPEALRSAETYDMFGNPLTTDVLTPQVAYFHLDALPADWDAQRHTHLISASRYVLDPGMTVDVQITAPGATKVAFDLPDGFETGKWKQDGDTWTGTLHATLHAAPGAYDGAVVVEGDGWSKRLYLSLVARPAVVAQSLTYMPGEPIELKLVSKVDQATEATVALGQDETNALTVKLNAMDAQDVILTAPGDVRGALPLSIRPTDGAPIQTMLRPMTINVRQRESVQIDGEPDVTDAGADLPRDAFSPWGDSPERAWLAWTPEGLWIAVESPAPLRESLDPKNFWEWTNFEVFLDTGDTDAKGWPETARQFYFVPARDPESGAWKLFAGEWNRRPQMTGPTFDDDRITTAMGVWDRHDTIYMEALIPWDAIGATPDSSATWRGAVTIQTASDVHERTGMAWPDAKPDGLLDGVERWATWTFTP